MLVVFAIAASACVGQRAESPSPVVRLDALDSFVADEMARQRIPGCGIALLHRGEPVKVRGYGLANLEHDVAATSATIFQSGSMGKQFTAALVMLLVEDGRLRLDESIATYLPTTPAALRAITIRHLLNHTSGLADYTTESFDYRRDRTEDELLGLAFAQPLEFAAGARWSYSNTGYVILGILAGKVGGRFYGDQLRDRIFAPAGMKTAQIIDEAGIVPHRADGYQLDGEVMKHHDWVAPTINTTADGALYYSIDDLVAWNQVLRSGAILRPESWDQVYAPARLNSGKTFPYAAGWFVAPINGHRVFRHGGAWQGFRTDLLRYPDDDVTVIALCNLATAEPERLTDGLAALLDPSLAAPALAPIPDRDPAITARLHGLLAAAAAGTLAATDFAGLRAGMFAHVQQLYPTLLGRLGAPTRVTLVSREELGDDVVFGYQVTYTTATFDVALALGPDDKIASFRVRPRR